MNGHYVVTAKDHNPGHVEENMELVQQVVGSHPDPEVTEAMLCEAGDGPHHQPPPATSEYHCADHQEERSSLP